MFNSDWGGQNVTHPDSYCSTKNIVGAMPVDGGPQQWGGGVEQLEGLGCEVGRDRLDMELNVLARR